MKLIEAMKQQKDLARKAEDLRLKIQANSAHLSFETPAYADQKGQVSEWLQAHSDVLKEIMRLRVAVQRTNLSTSVTIELQGKTVTKTIAEWIHRRRDLAKTELDAWKCLTDKNLREVRGKDSQGQEVDVKIVRCFDPRQRDERMAALQSEPSLIDGKLEVVNAVTDLME